MSTSSLHVFSLIVRSPGCEVVKFYEDVFDGRVGSVVVGVVVQADVGCDELTTWVVCD